MVPLEKVLQKPASKPEPLVIPREASSEREAPERREPPTFKVVDALSRQVLAVGADTRATVDLLEGTRSIVDLRVYVWESGAEKWRLLSLGEQKALRELRNR
jgi:hypothetical protein